MKISSIIPALGLAGVTAFSAAAQNDPKPQRLQLQIVPRAAGGALLARPIALPRLQLDLTDKQKNKISEIRKEQSQATREINQNKELGLQDRRDQISDLRAEYQQKRDWICQALTEAGMTPYAPDGAYYVLADASHLPGETSKEKTMHFLCQAGVAGVPGEAFFHDGTGENLIRFCFAKSQAELKEACRKIRSFRM